MESMAQAVGDCVYAELRQAIGVRRTLVCGKLTLRLVRGACCKGVEPREYTFYNPVLHPEFTAADSPVLIFEGLTPCNSPISPRPLRGTTTIKSFTGSIWMIRRLRERIAWNGIDAVQCSKLLNECPGLISRDQGGRESVFPASRRELAGSFFSQLPAASLSLRVPKLSGDSVTRLHALGVWKL